MANFEHQTFNKIFYFITNTFNITTYIFLVTLLSTYFIIRKCRRDQRLDKFSKTIPGPQGLPLIGNALPFVFNGLGNCNKVLRRYSEKYGSIYKLWLGNELVIGLSDVDHLEVVFRSTKALSRPPILFEGYRQMYGNSLFTTSTPVWKHTRKQLQPVFGKNVMKFQLPLIQKYVDKYVNLMKNHINSHEFNVDDYTQPLSVDSFLGIYYNLHMNSKELEYFKFHDIFNFSIIYGFSKILFPWLRMHSISKLYFGNKKEDQDKKLREFFNILKSTGQGEEIGNIYDYKEKSLLSIIENLEKDMKIENYAYNETTNFLIAAAGTTSTALSFCLLAIAMHPDIQDKLYNEMNAILGDSNRPITMDDLSKFVYLNQVLKESARLFTLFHNILRGVEEDIKIDEHLTIPAKTTIMVRIGDVHMNSNLYPNPYKFNPENFNAEAISQRSKYSFLAFSMGTRDCIGKYLADCILKLTVISLLRQFKLSTTIQMQDIEFTGSFSVEKVGGYWIKIESRK